MTTAGDLVERCLANKLIPATSQRVGLLTSSILAGATTLQVTDPSGSITAALRPGVRLGIDYEVFLVISQPSASNVVTVIPGYEGSTQAAHNSNVPIYFDPKFSRFAALTEINNELSDLSSPANGLGQVAAVNITFNPAFASYDLGVTNVVDILEIRYKTPSAPFWRPPIKRWKLLRNQDTADFASGNALIVYGDSFGGYGAYPGLPMRITYLAPFTQFAGPTDDALAVSGLVQTMLDIPAIGAAIALVEGREIKRNFTESQPDPRIATEVLAGASMNSTNGLLRHRSARIRAEADRLRLAYDAVRR